MERFEIRDVMSRKRRRYNEPVKPFLSRGPDDLPWNDSNVVSYDLTMKQGIPVIDHFVSSDKATSEKPPFERSATIFRA